MSNIATIMLTPGGITFAIPCFVMFEKRKLDHVMYILLGFPVPINFILLTSMPQAIYQFHEYAMTKKTEALRGPSKLLLPLFFIPLGYFTRSLHRTLFNNQVEVMGLLKILPGILEVLHVLVFGILLGSLAESFVWKCKEVWITKNKSVLRKDVNASKFWVYT